MELSEEELDQPNETEWIERRAHDLILRKYRLNTQRLIKEYQNQIQKQNEKIEMLMKQVKRQKCIINSCSFTNKNGKTISTKTLPRLESSKMEETSDLELETYHPETEILIETKAEAKDKNQNLLKLKRQPIVHKTTINNRRIATQIENKKPSLVSIHIQPNLQHSTSVYICDQCNKSMSSRRVLAVWFHQLWTNSIDIF